MVTSDPATGAQAQGMPGSQVTLSSGQASQVALSSPKPGQGAAGSQVSVPFGGSVSVSGVPIPGSGVPVLGAKIPVSGAVVPDPDARICNVKLNEISSILPCFSGNPGGERRPLYQQHQVRQTKLCSK